MSLIDSTICVPTHRAAPVSVWMRLSRAATLWHQRRQLKTLSADALNDIGITHAQALEESNRPAWDVPAHWRG